MRRYSFRILTIHMLAAVALACSVSAGAQDKGTPSASAKSKVPPYALIFGTVWDAQNRPVYGVPVKIRRAGQNKAEWNLISDHRGEFAQRVPAGKADYVVKANLKPPKGNKDWKAPETTAHVENDERIDVGLHLTE